MNVIWLLAATEPGRIQLVDFVPGHSPVVAHGIILLAILLVGIVLYQIANIYHRRRLFRRHCEEHYLTSNEISSLNSQIRRFNVRDPLTVVYDVRSFDQLIDNLAHSFIGTSSPDEVIGREARRYSSIREKFRWTYSWDEAPLKSTRAIREGTPLLVRYRDPDSGQQHTFLSEVIRNTDLFWGIRAPITGTDRTFISGRRPHLDIKLFGPNEEYYSIEARYVRTSNQPVPHWQLMHTGRLLHAPAQSGPGIEALLMISRTDDEGGSCPVIINHLTPIDCCFRQTTIAHPPKVGDTCILSFELDGSSITLQVQILRISDQRPYALYALITDTTEEIKKRLMLYNKNMANSI